MDKDKGEEIKFEKEIKKSRWIFVRMIIVSVLLVCGILFIYSRVLISWYNRPQNGAELGDSYGLANALFSALAFAFLIVTSILQRRELELQRIQLKDNNKELAVMALAQKRSQEILNMQVSLMAKQTLLNSYQKRYDEVQNDIKENPSTLKYRVNIQDNQEQLLNNIIQLEKDIAKLSELSDSIEK